jgi:outer membrane protein assembly factor BamB
VNKIVIFFILIFLTSGCSFNKNSKFWTASQNIPEESNPNYQEIFAEEEALNKELNANVSISLGDIFNNNSKVRDYFNNDGRLDYDGILKKSSRYKFSKIKNFYQFEPKISFNDNNLVFFDNKGSILKFDDKSKLIWKKNYYSKSEKKLKPILQFANDGKTLVVADNIAKYFALDINTGELLWSKNNLAPFNSQIKIFEDKFFIIDFSNTLRCFSLKNGEELWNIRTENSLIRSQKKLSMVIVNNLIYFKNSIGDISAVDINEGELLWQLPTQSSLIYEAAFSLETSDLITDGNTLFFSNNKNQFFSIDLGTGSFNWENQVNSSLRPIVADKFIFSISDEGYLFIIDKFAGNIIKITDLFDVFNDKKRKKIYPVGFVIGRNDLFVTTNHGRIMVVDLKNSKTKSIKKIDNKMISRPFIFSNQILLATNNAVIKLN